MRYTVMPIFGTRPETTKFAALIKTLRRDPAFEVVVTTTGQHREMLDQALKVFDVRPDVDLDVMTPGQTLSSLSCRVLEGLEAIFLAKRPDLVLVQGDTATVLAGALSAFYHGIPVGHVEAGLRTEDKRNPFPEEMNRRLTGQIADLHFAPTQRARQNLLAEGLVKESVFVTGNTQIDGLMMVVDHALELPLEVSPRPGHRTILMTTHRRENHHGPLEAIYRALRRCLERFPDVDVIFPVHLNPNVQEAVASELKPSERVRLVSPLDYRTMANVMARSHLVLTDSGGLQEEAPALGKPVLVTRTNTERPEGVEAGTARLVGVEEELVFSALCEFLGDESAYARMARAINPYGDGKASERIHKALRYHFGLDSKRPEDFAPASE